MKNGFIKVAAASPVIRVADPDYNAEQIKAVLEEAGSQGVKVLVFPALTLTGCSCYDLFRHRVLLQGAEQALLNVLPATEGRDMLVFVGLPLAVGAKVYSVAAALYEGEILALIPRTDASDAYFSVPEPGSCVDVELEGYGAVTMTDEVLFQHEQLADLQVAVEVGATLDRFCSAAALRAAAGASVLAEMALNLFILLFLLLFIFILLFIYWLKL